MTRRGFTLVELLVTTAVVVVCLALGAPAISQLTQDARRNQCRNNLRQIGLALHNYHDVFNTFPPGWVSRDGLPGTGSRTGWQASLLPYLDQAPLYNLVNFNASSLDESGKPLKLFQTALAVYRCPTDPTPETNPLRGEFGTSNYSGNYGPQPTPRLTPMGLSDFWPGAVVSPMRTTGLFARNSVGRIRDVTDGTSNTLLVGERGVTSGSAIWPGVTHDAREDDTLTEASHRAQINEGWHAYSSLHGGGIHILLCDGAVRFINEKIDSKPAPVFGVWQILAGRNDGMVLPELK